MILATLSIMATIACGWLCYQIYRDLKILKVLKEEGVTIEMEYQANLAKMHAEIAGDIESIDRSLDSMIANAQAAVDEQNKAIETSNNIIKMLDKMKQ